MTGLNHRVETIEKEAAAWHVRLGARVVSTDTVEEFFAWRSVPENAEAYQRVEKVWSGSAGLRHEPAMAGAVREAMERQPKRQRSRALSWAWMGLAGACAAAVLVVGGLMWADARTVFSTAVGEQRVVQLADGSTVRLDTGSRIRMRYDADERLILLDRGQAMFTVAHEGRPFVVDAAGARVTAVGTVFDVRRDGDAVSVILVSGKVDVARSGVPAQAGRRLVAGQRSLISVEGVAVQAVDVQAETSWTDGRIVFENTPLDRAVAEVNRYLTAKIELEATELGRVPVNGVFKTGDRDAFVAAATDLFALRSVETSSGGIRLLPENNSSRAPG